MRLSSSTQNLLATSLEHSLRLCDLDEECVSQMKHQASEKLTNASHLKANDIRERRNGFFLMVDSCFQ